MGIAYAKIKVRNPLREIKTIELDAKVDTGATLLVLPGEVAEELKFPSCAKRLSSMLMNHERSAM